MAKQQLNEGLVERLMVSLFLALAKKKDNQVLPKVAKLPKIEKATKQLIAARDYLEKEIQRMRQDPKIKDFDDEFNKGLRD